MESKSFLQSKAILGVLALVLAMVCRKWGVEITSEETAALAEGILEIAGLILVVWGRVSAKTKLHITAPTKTIVVLLMIPLMAMSIQGCATIPAGDSTAVEENAYKVLLSAKLTYEATMPALAQAYNQGLLTEEEKDSIIAGAKKFLGAYRLAVVALAEYVKVKNTESEQQLTTALKDMNVIFAEFLAFVTPYLTKKEGV